MSTKAELEAVAELLHEVGRACERIDVLKEANAQLRSDLAREKERADKAEAHRLADGRSVMDAEEERDKAKARLAALQAHADALAEEAERLRTVVRAAYLSILDITSALDCDDEGCRLSKADREQLGRDLAKYGVKDYRCESVLAYRAFTAEGPKK